MLHPSICTWIGKELMVPIEQLPIELWSGVLEHNYGSSLRVGFVGRIGLIYLKMYAVLGREERRDIEDLLAMAPTSAECRAAVSWLQSCGLIDEANQGRLQNALKELGHHDVFD